MDGANSWTQLWKVYLPLARPAIFTHVLLSFTWTWNDYFRALILVSDPAHQPRTLGLGAFSGRYLVRINFLAVAAILISLPVVALLPGIPAAVHPGHAVRRGQGVTSLVPRSRLDALAQLPEAQDAGLHLSSTCGPRAT